MLAALVLLGLSIVSIWLPPISLRRSRELPIWVIVFVAATITALLSGVVDWRGLLALGVLAWTSWLSCNGPDAVRRRAASVAAIGIAFLLGVGLLPGFGGWLGGQDIRLGPDASPMGLGLRFAPGAAGLFLAAVFCQRVRSWRELRATLRSALLVAAVTIPVVMLLGTFSGYVRWDPKLPWFTAAFVAKTLLLTAVMEEAFFRGVVQEGLSRWSWVAAHPNRRWLPVAAVALLFGLAHARAGLLFVALATLAGLGYSTAYALTRRIEAPIVVHAGLNTVHFLLFTYPHLLTAP